MALRVVLLLVIPISARPPPKHIDINQAMRVHPPLLLAATTIAMCTLSASVAIGSKTAQVDRQTTTPSQVGGHNTVHDNRRLQATHATGGEERALLSRGASSSLRALREELTMLLLGKSHAIVNSAPVARLRATPTVYDAPLFEEYALVKDNYPGRRKMEDKVIFEGTGFNRDVVKTLQLFGKTITVKTPKDGVVARVRDPDAERVFGVFKQAHPSPNLFQPSTLDLFKNVVKEFNEGHSKDYTLLDALVIMFDGEDNLAPALSKAKMFASSQHTATDLQLEMMKVWIREKRSADDVFYVLKLDELEKRGLQRENLETFDAFFALHHQLGLDDLNYQLDTVEFLRYKFGEIRFLQMIKKDMEHLAYPNKTVECYLKLLLKHRTSLRRIVGVLVAAGFADAMVVRLLSAGYGGVAKFAQALSDVRANAIHLAHKATVEALHAALEDYKKVNKNSADGVNNWLELFKDAGSSRPSPSIDKESVRKRQKTR